MTAEGRRRENGAMETNTDSPLPPEVQADIKEAWRQIIASGRVTDPDLARRIRGYSEQAREETLRKHGVLNVAVDLIREGRDEE